MDIAYAMLHVLAMGYVTVQNSSVHNVNEGDCNLIVITFKFPLNL